MKKIDTTTLSVPFVDSGKEFEHMIITGPTRTGMSVSTIIPGLMDLLASGHAGGVVNGNQYKALGLTAAEFHEVNRPEK